MIRHLLPEKSPEPLRDRCVFKSILEGADASKNDFPERGRSLHFNKIKLKSLSRPHHDSALADAREKELSEKEQK